jgi:hypothetical protein
MYYSPDSTLKLGEQNFVKVDINYITSAYSNWVGCLSHREATKLLIWKKSAISKKTSTPEDNQMQDCNYKLIKISLDLGLSQRELYADETGVGLLKSCINSGKNELNYFITWEEVDSISRKKNACFALYDDGSKPWQISTISKTSGRPASLCPATALIPAEEDKNV